MTKESFEAWEKKLLTMDPEAAKKIIDAAMPSKLRPGASLMELGDWFDQEKDKPWCQFFDQAYLARHQPVNADYWVEPQWDKRKNNQNFWNDYPWQHDATNVGRDIGIIVPNRKIYDEVVTMICERLNKHKTTIENRSKISSNKSQDISTNTNSSSMFSQNSILSISIPNKALFHKIKPEICAEGTEAPLAKYADFCKALNEEDYTLALQLTGRYNNIKLAKILLEHQPALDININAFSNGNAVIHSAFGNKNWDFVNLLAIHGADTQSASKISGMSADDFRPEWDPNFGCCARISKGCVIV